MTNSTRSHADDVVQLRRPDLGAKRRAVEPSISEQNHSHVCGDNLSNREEHLGLDRSLTALAVLGRHRGDCLA